MVYKGAEAQEMIEKLSIKNFKSIKDMSIDCKRINLFIGEPNTGKSNIIETLGLGSWLGVFNIARAEINSFLRYQILQDLFYDNLLDKKIEIEYQAKNIISLKLEHAMGRFDLRGNLLSSKQDFHLSFNQSGALEYLNIIKGLDDSLYEGLSLIKYYKFLKQNSFDYVFSPYLLPPFGVNLFTLAMGNKEISDIIAQFFHTFDLQLLMKPRDYTFEITKQKDNLLISYPYTSTSDTLQRMIFFSAAMESNKDSTLIFEEPESFAFPYYTKYLGERIAFDDSNQYFISTHNPYLLMAILEKTPRNAVNVFITYLKDYKTRVKQLTEEEISELMDLEADPFFNLGYFLDEEHE
jgi:AAA15 family ATPase/GTPase